MGPWVMISANWYYALDVGRGQFFRVVDKIAWLVIGAAVAMLAKVSGLG